MFFASCSTESVRLLRDADAIMEEYPDSAMSILEGIDSHNLKGNALPYYALLYTQAQIKTDVPIDSDSLISIAYAKYGNHTRGDLGIRSNFYTGEIFFNQEKYREAMKFYLTAYEESKRLSNYYWQAKAAERISDLFFFAYNYDEAEKYALEAAKLFKIVGRQINHRYSLGQLSIIYLNNGHSDIAYMMLDSLYTLSLLENPCDSAFLEYIKMPLIDAGAKMGKNVSIKLNGEDFCNKSLSNRELIDAVILQSQLLNLSDTPSLMKDLSNIDSLARTDEDKIHILYAEYLNAKASGHNSLALSFVDSMLYYYNVVAENIIKESVTGAQRDFYIEMSTVDRKKSIFMNYLLSIFIGVFILVIAFLIIFSYLRNKAQKAKLEAIFESFLSLKSYSDRILKEKEIAVSVLKTLQDEKEAAFGEMITLKNINMDQEISHAEIVERLFKEKWTTLDTLCNQYFGLSNSEITAKGVVTNIEKEIKKIVSKKGIIEIVEAVDTYIGGIVTRLRSQCQFLKEDDITFLALIYAGFSVRSVCLFTSIKYQHFYVKKSRLIKRIKDSNAPDKDFFLKKIK